MSDDKPMTSMSDDEESVRILPPSYRLKEKIGMDVKMSEIFTPERIAAAQKAIDDTQSEFVGWAQKDLVELEHAYRTMEKDPSSVESRSEKVRKIAFSLKCQAGTFGYPLGSEVAKSLFRYTVDHAPYSKESLIVLRKHIDALMVIFQQNIQGEGGKMGEELLGSLDKLVAKFN
jgi:hypothetical protein